MESLIAVGGIALTLMFILGLNSEQAEKESRTPEELEAIWDEYFREKYGI